MISKKNIFSLVISLLLAANAFVGPLVYLYVIIFELLSRLQTSAINLLVFPLLWLGFYFLVRIVCESRRLRHPLVVIGVLVITIVFSEIYLILHMGGTVNLNLIVGLMVAIGPVVFVSALYLISVLTIHFINPEKRYLVATILMSAFLLLMIVIKNNVIISVSCMGMSLNPTIPQVRRNTQPNELLSIFTTKKCIPSPGGYITNPAAF
jgi:hypothetical protein